MVVGILAVVYVFLLVVVPLLVAMIPGSVTYNETETGDITIPLTPVGPPVSVEDITQPFWERYKAPWIIYAIPGLVGIAIIVVILKQGGKADE